MGAAVSSNLTKLTTNIISESLTNVVKNETTNIQNSQVLTIQNVSGNVIIENNVFDIKVDVNMKSLVDALNDSNIRQNMEEEIAQASKALIKDLNLGNISDATNDIENYINDTLKISNSLSDICATQVNTNQVITVDKVGGNVIFRENEIRSAIKILENCIQNAVSKSSAVNSLQQVYAQTAASETKGISPWAIASIIGTIALAIAGSAILPVIAPVVVGGKYPIIFSAIFVVAAIVFLVIWGVWSRKAVKSTLWSRLYKNTCYSMRPVKTAKVENADSAVSRCISEGYAAYDFVAYERDPINGAYNILDEPYALFYDSVDKGCVITQDELPLLTTRKVFVTNKRYEGVEAPSGASFVPYGAVNINTGQGFYQEFKGRWSMPHVFLADYFKTAAGNAASSYVAASSQFTSKMGLVQVNFGNLSFAIPPSILENGDSTAPLVLRADSENLYTFTITNRRTGTESEAGSFAAFGKITAMDLKPNVSGYVYKARKSWALYAGIGCVAGAVIVAAILSKKKKEVPARERSNAFSAGS